VVGPVVLVGVQMPEDCSETYCKPNGSVFSGSMVRRGYINDALQRAFEQPMPGLPVFHFVFLSKLTMSVDIRHRVGLDAD
jgi:hypothetical protein